MSFDEKPWRGRGVFVSNGERYVGLAPGAPDGSPDHAVSESFRTGSLVLENALELAYITAPLMSQTGDISVRRFAHVAPVLLTTQPQRITLRPLSVLLFKDLSPADLAFWLPLIEQAIEQAANVQRLQSSGIVSPPPNFNPNKQP